MRDLFSPESQSQHQSQGPYAKPGRVLQAPAKIVATYDYLDEAGEVLYQVCRMEPKSFRQRRPCRKTGGWIWDMEGVRRVLYNLPDILTIRPDWPVVIVEGEKDADALDAIGFLATTNAGGAGRWQDDFSVLLTSRRVAIIPDNDEAGRSHAVQVAGSLLVHGHVASVRIVELPGLPLKGDVSDWLAALPASTDARKELAGVIRQSPEWRRL